MNTKTTIAGQIEGLVKRLDGAAICDDCVTDRLYLSVRSQANVVTRGLGGKPGFERYKALCAFCKTAKTVTHYRA